MFADDIELVYSFWLSSLIRITDGVMTDVVLLDDLCGQCAFKFSATKMAVLAYEFHAPRGSLIINHLPILTDHCRKNLGLQYSCFLNSNEQTIGRIANTNETDSFIVEPSRTLSCKLTP